MKEDEIYLIDMARLLARHWRWFAVAMALVLAATAVFNVLAKPQWEATAWIQVGEIGPTPAGRDPKVEPFQRVLDRIKTRLFQDAVLRSAGVPLNGRAAQLYRKSLKPDPDPYANLIGVTIRAGTADQARMLATATANALQAVHGPIEAAALDSARARARILGDELATATARRDRLQQQLAASGGNPTQAQVLAGLMLADANGTVRGLRAEREDLIARLDPRYTYPTSLAWPLYVPDRQAFPNPVVTWGIGLLLSLALGALAAVLGGAWHRYRASSVGHA
jgi:hypothetical protein